MLSKPEWYWMISPEWNFDILFISRVLSLLSRCPYPQKVIPSRLLYTVLHAVSLGSQLSGSQWNLCRNLRGFRFRICSLNFKKSYHVCQVTFVYTISLRLRIISPLRPHILKFNDPRFFLFSTICYRFCLFWNYVISNHVMASLTGRPRIRTPDLFSLVITDRLTVLSRVRVKKTQSLPSFFNFTERFYL